MTIVLITALGVGLSTVIGALIGFLFKNISHRVSDYILAFAGGVMLSAAFFGLILPSFNEDEPITLVTTIIGIFTGFVLATFREPLLSLLNIETQGAFDLASKLILIYCLWLPVRNIPYIIIG